MTLTLPVRVCVAVRRAQVRLLLGEVPERSEFAVPGLVKPLRPYFELTQAVRSGDLVAFGQVRQGAARGWLNLECHGRTRLGGV